MKSWFSRVKPVFVFIVSAVFCGILAHAGGSAGGGSSGGDGITVSPSEMTPGTVGTSYSQVFTVSGVSQIMGANAAWSPSNPGSGFTGFSTDKVNNTLTLSGMPTKAGTFTLTMTMFYSANGATASIVRTFPFTVSGGSSGGGGSGGGDGVTVSPSTMVAGTVGLPYSQVFTVSGISQLLGANASWSPYSPGTGFIGFSVDKANNTLTMSGTPTKTGTFTLTMSMTYLANGASGNIVRTFPLTVSESGGGGGGGGSTEPTATITSASPTPYTTTHGPTGNSTKITLADGDSLTVSVNVDTDPSDAEIDYYWTSDGSTEFANADRTSNRFTLTYSASASDTPIYCDIFKKGVHTGTSLARAIWVIAPVELPPSITVSPPMSDVVVNQPFSTRTFSVPGKTTSSWQLQTLSGSRRANSFADIVSKMTRAEKLTITSGQATKSLSVPYSFAGASFQNFTIGNGFMNSSASTYSCSMSSGMSGQYSYPNADDGIYYALDGDSHIFRWKGVITTYETSGGGGSSGGGSAGGGGSSGGGSSGGGGSGGMVQVPHQVDFAIILCPNGEVAMAYGDCNGMVAQTASVSGSGPSGQLSGNLAVGEAASTTTQDIVFRKALPSGMTASSKGSYVQLMGTPTETGTFTFTVSCYVSDTGMISSNFTFAVNASSGGGGGGGGTIQIKTGSLPGGTVGSSYSAIIEVESSSELNTVQLNGGTLPPGLSFSLGQAGAILGGVPTTAGNYSFNVKISNKDGAQATKTYSMTIASSGGGGGGGGSDPELKGHYPSQSTVDIDVGASQNFAVSMQPSTGCTYSWKYIEIKGDGEPPDPESSDLFVNADKSTCSFSAGWAAQFEVYCYVNGNKVYTWTVNVTQPVPQNHIWYVDQNIGKDTYNGLSYSTPKKNVYAVQNAIAGDEIRIMAFSGDFIYCADGVRYIATNGNWTVNVGSNLEKVELGTNGKVYINVTSQAILASDSTTVKIVKVPEGAQISDYDTATSGGGSSGGGSAGGGSAGGGGSSGGGGATSFYRILWPSGITWGGDAYIDTTDNWIKRVVVYPAPVKIGQTPTADTASQQDPLALTEGSMQSFTMNAQNTTSGLTLSYRWELDDTAIPGSLAYVNYTPVHSLVDGNVHHLVCYVSNEFHTDAVRGDWYFTVEPAPLQCDVTLIRDYIGPFSFDLAAHVTGGEGDREFEVLGDGVDGVELSDAGVISGKMTDDLRDQILTVRIADQAGAAVTNEIAFIPRHSGEEDFYLLGCTPDVAELEVFLGDMPKFTINATSDSVPAVNRHYLWFWDDTLVNNNTTEHTLGYGQLNPNYEGETHVLSVYGSQTSGSEKHGTLLKQWYCTISDHVFDFKTTELPVMEVGKGAQKALIEFNLPYGCSITKLEYLRGSLPPGFRAYGSTLAGRPRMSGTYEFTLRATCSNGDIAQRTFSMTVTGTDDPPHDWYVDPSGTPHGADHNELSVAAVIDKGVMTGDRIYIYSGTYQNVSSITDMPGVEVHIVGDVVMTIDYEGVLDISDFIIDPGASLSFEKGNAFTLQEEMYGWKYPVRLIRVPAGSVASDFTVSGFSYPEYLQTPQIDANGWLYLEKGLRLQNNRWSLVLPDKAGRRDAVFSNYTFDKPLDITSTGVIPGTVTFSGAVTLKQTSLTDAGGGVVKIVVASDAVLTLDYGISCYNNPVEIKPGATLRTPTGHCFSNRRLIVPSPSQGKFNLELTTPMGGFTRYEVFLHYAGADDPSDQINLSVPDDASRYRWELWYGNLVLTTRPLTGDGDPGTLSWDESADATDIGTFAPNAAISKTFNVSGGDTAYPYSYSTVGEFFQQSRDDVSSFPSVMRLGARELRYRPIRMKGSSPDDTVDIGFAFPFCGKYYSSCRVGTTGRLWFTDNNDGPSVWLLANSLLWTLDTEQTFCDVYIHRTENTFTVRYGEFGAITLTPDGKVRMSFGKDGSLLPAGNLREPIRCTAQLDYLHISSFETANNDYANQPDVVFTPTGLAPLTFTGTELTGTINVPGEYTVGVKVVDHQQKTMTRNFTFTVSEDENMPQLVSVSAPELSADGFIHLAPNETTNFSAVVSGGAKAKWTLQYGNNIETSGATYSLTAPASRTVNCLARVILEVEDEDGKWTGIVRKSWWVSFRKVFSIESDSDIPPNLNSVTMPGDEFVLTPGTYTRCFDFKDNPAPVVIRSSTGNAADVIINGGHLGRCFRQAEAEKVVSAGTSAYQIAPYPVRNSRIENVTLINGMAGDEGLYFWNQGAIMYGIAGGAVFGGDLYNCDIYLSEAVAELSDGSYGGGAYGARLTGCLIAGCQAMFGGGCSNCELHNCTVADNLGLSAAGGLDGECYAENCIIRYNYHGDEACEYEPTYRPHHLVADVPEIINCFTTGDPLFCSDYSLAVGSPASGKGAFPVPHAGDCRITVEPSPGGTVDPRGEFDVRSGASQTFTFSGRPVVEVLVNDVHVAGPVTSYTLENVTANKRLRVVFETKTLKVGPTQEYSDIVDALADAIDGDVIEVDEGVYSPIDFGVHADRRLEIRATGAVENTIIDGGGTQRCFFHPMGLKYVKMSGFTFRNGYASRVGADDGNGGGVYGGIFEDCVISNCVAMGGYGGGAYYADLTRCGLYCNRAGDRSITGTWFKGAWGGGAYGGSLYDCRVNGNRICANNKPSSDGAGTYNARVSYSFVWGNYADIDVTSYDRSNNAKEGQQGIVYYTEERVPTAANLAARKTPAPANDVQYFATESEALAAAAKFTIDFEGAIAKNLPSAAQRKAYTELFVVKTELQPNGEYKNSVDFRSDVKELIREQANSVIFEDDQGNQRTEFRVTKMEKVLTETVPGLYYALEFSSDGKTWRGTRHLATGSGSIKLSTTSLDTATGLWRVAVYVTFDKDY